MGEALPEEETEVGGDGGKNSGKDLRSMRCTESMRNHDERDGTVKGGGGGRGEEPAADGEDAEEEEEEEGDEAEADGEEADG